MYSIRLEEDRFVFSYMNEDEYFITGDFEEGYVVYNIGEEAVYSSISFEECVTWVINS